MRQMFAVTFGVVALVLTGAGMYAGLVQGDHVGGMAAVGVGILALWACALLARKGP